jgi:predicted glycosyltransferase
MRIWYDACTGKQVRYAVAIAQRLRACGHEMALTTRNHPDTLALAKILKEKFVVVGEYATGSLMAKLQASLQRQMQLAKMFEKKPPDTAISHRSVELCRVAFGLGIPNISTHDTVHADAVNRLTMPLITYLVISKALPKTAVESYGTKKIFWFDGVDEVAWIRGLKPPEKRTYKKPLIVVRELEQKAAYAQGKEDPTKTLAKKLAKLGNVLFLPRYNKRAEKGLNIPSKFVDSASIVTQADLVISAGGTIAREAALQGVPTIIVPSFGRIYVNDYLSDKGFPLFTVSMDKVYDCAKQHVGKKQDVKALLDSLENPVDVIERVIKEEIEK